MSSVAVQYFLIPLSFALIALATPSSSARAAKGGDVVLVIHGGAGTIERSSMTPDREAKYRATLSEALGVGYKVLHSGGSAMDAVEATICVMEDSPLFNAGRGSVFTNDGHNEMDASIMDGKTHEAGAVAAVRGIKNPIKAARLVMEKTSHVLLVGDGACQFAREQGLAFEDSAYFYTDQRWKELERVREEEKKKKSQYGSIAFPHTHLGTVGAVALDSDGNLAAATSTGGLTNKHWGRVGDSPIIGAGTYADNATCAVSCTGVGEYFIRGSFAHEVSTLMHFEKISVQEAARRVIHEELVQMGGEGTGGLIALDAHGNFALEFNTPGMYRGYVRADGTPHVFIYNDE